MTFHSVMCAAIVAASAIISAPADAQRLPDDSTRTKTFFTKRDLAYAGAVLAGSVAVSHFDLRIRNWTQTPKVLGDSSRADLANTLTKINELPLTLIAIGTYGLGRLSHSNTVTDVGLHTAEALILTIGVSELIRIPVGRRRPKDSPTDQYKFTFGSGLTKFEDRSFPSLHASAAFATASALSGELRLRNPGAAKYVTPVLYAAALVPGGTRLYLDQHWASDVVAGSFVGALLGSRVVKYAHSHSPNWLDRMLAGATVVPDGSGGALITASLKL